jgi:uncharacterized protein YjbJ (UPF0337 family)
MGEFENKVKGMGKEVAGKAQQAWGEATDQPEHSGEGIARETEGKAQRKIGEAQGQVDDKVDDLTDRIRDDRKR